MNLESMEVSQKQKMWGTWCTCCWTHSQYYQYQPNF